MQEPTEFTIHRDPSIDFQLAEQMKVIVDEITRTYKEVYSIILAGGFGRGEGSIKIVEGRVVPLKDFDIYVITDHKINEDEYMNMIKRIHRRIGIESSWYFSVGPGEFNVGIQAIPLRKLERLPPDIANIDLKLASKILYGEDLRKRINIGLDDIILSTGALVLLNKAIGLLEQIDLDPDSRTLRIERKNAAIYECGKTFVEMCTALTILAKKYVPSYAQRAKAFSRFFVDKFPDLAKKFPDLPSRVTFFTSVKLSSRFDECEEEPIKLWFITRQYFNEVLRYYMGEFLGINPFTDDWTDFCREAYRELGFKFFKEYIHYNLRDMPFYHTRLLPLLSFVGQVYDNLAFVNRIRSVKKKVYLPPILNWRSPLIKIFSASVLALNSINEDGSVDGRRLDKAIYYIKQAYPVKTGVSSLTQQWNVVRKACVESQKSYFTRKEVIAI